MENKKVKAGSVAIGICLFVIAILLVFIVLFFYNSNKEKNETSLLLHNVNIENKHLKEKNDLLNQRIKEKEEKVIELENNLQQYENEGQTNIDNEEEKNIIKIIENVDLISNGQIVEINENTKRFNSEKVSFEFPKSWMISQSDDDINIISPMSSVRINIWPEENYDYNDLKDIFLISDYGTIVVDEGEIKVSGKNAYFRETDFGDGPSYFKTKTIAIDLGDGKYYKISLQVESNETTHDYSEKELLEIYDEYEPIFDNIISTLKFEK